MKQSRVAALALVTTLIAACGGGGGGDAPGLAPSPPGSPAPPALPGSGALNAQEQLAYQSWAIRTLTSKWVTDDDNLITAGAAIPVITKLQFAGLYPTASTPGTTSTANLPNDIDGLFQCKEGGTSTKSEILINNNGTFDAGESLITSFVGCKDGAFTGNGTSQVDFRATDTVYPSPNDNAVKSSSFVKVYDRTYTATLLQGTFAGSQKGALDANITELTRTYKLVNLAYTYEQGTMVGNTTINISRTDNFGFDQPFTVNSISGTVQVDGRQFTITSTAIPWRTTSSTGVNYFPKSGSITATGPNGEKIFTQFGTDGARCTLTPQGAAVPSVTVEKCSRI
jgi:hypothetical protein